jgi:hypothetical protein
MVAAVFEGEDGGHAFMLGPAEGLSTRVMHSWIVLQKVVSQKLWLFSFPHRRGSVTSREEKEVDCATVL